MKELKKQHLEMLQLLESIEVMLQNGNSIHPNSVIRGAIQTAIGMEVDVTNVNDKCDNKQTAVEWLVEQMKQRESQGLTLSMYELEMFGEQAKAMEKEQKIQFATEYSNHILNHGLLTPTEFFKQNFKSK